MCVQRENTIERLLIYSKRTVYRERIAIWQLERKVRLTDRSRGLSDIDSPCATLFYKSVLDAVGKVGMEHPFFEFSTSRWIAQKLGKKRGLDSWHAFETGPIIFYLDRQDSCRLLPVL